ncbi:MAG: hypothetical protein R3A47_09405 [Polyangiales bacterium]
MINKLTFIAVLLFTFTSIDASAQRLEITADLGASGQFSSFEASSINDGASDTFLNGTSGSFRAGGDVRYFANSGHGVVGDVYFDGGVIIDSGSRFNFYTTSLNYAYRLELLNRGNGALNFDTAFGVRTGYANASTQNSLDWGFSSDEGRATLTAADRANSGFVIGPNVAIGLSRSIKRFTVGVDTNYSPLFHIDAPAKVTHNIGGQVRIGFNLDRSK